MDSCAKRNRVRYLDLPLPPFSKTLKSRPEYVASHRGGYRSKSSKRFSENSVRSSCSSSRLTSSSRDSTTVSKELGGRHEDEGRKSTRSSGACEKTRVPPQCSQDVRNQHAKIVLSEGCHSKDDNGAADPRIARRAAAHYGHKGNAHAHESQESKEVSQRYQSLKQKLEELFSGGGRGSQDHCAGYGSALKNQRRGSIEDASMFSMPPKRCRRHSESAVGVKNLSSSQKPKTSNRDTLVPPEHASKGKLTENPRNACSVHSTDSNQLVHNQSSAEKAVVLQGQEKIKDHAVLPHSEGRTLEGKHVESHAVQAGSSPKIHCQVMEERLVAKKTQYSKPDWFDQERLLLYSVCSTAVYKDIASHSVPLCKRPCQNDASSEMPGKKPRNESSASSPKKATDKVVGDSTPSSVLHDTTFKEGKSCLETIDLTSDDDLICVASADGSESDDDVCIIEGVNPVSSEELPSNNRRDCIDNSDKLKLPPPPPSTSSTVLCSGSSKAVKESKSTCLHHSSDLQLGLQKQVLPEHNFKEVSGLVREIVKMSGESSSEDINGNDAGEPASSHLPGSNCESPSKTRTSPFVVYVRNSDTDGTGHSKSSVYCSVGASYGTANENLPSHEGYHSGKEMRYEPSRVNAVSCKTEPVSACEMENTALPVAKEELLEKEVRVKEEPFKEEANAASSVDACTSPIHCSESPPPPTASCTEMSDFSLCSQLSIEDSSCLFIKEEQGQPFVIFGNTDASVSFEEAYTDIENSDHDPCDKMNIVIENVVSLSDVIETSSVDLSDTYELLSEISGEDTPVGDGVQVDGDFRAVSESVFHNERSGQISVSHNSDEPNIMSSSKHDPEPCYIHNAVNTNEHHAESAGNCQVAGDPKASAVESCETEGVASTPSEEMGKEVNSIVNIKPDSEILGSSVESSKHHTGSADSCQAANDPETSASYKTEDVTSTRDEKIAVKVMYNVSSKADDEMSSSYSEGVDESLSAASSVGERPSPDENQASADGKIFPASLEKSTETLCSSEDGDLQGSEATLDIYQIEAILVALKSNFLKSKDGQQVVSEIVDLEKKLKNLNTLLSYKTGSERASKDKLLQSEGTVGGSPHLMETGGLADHTESKDCESVSEAGIAELYSIPCCAESKGETDKALSSEHLDGEVMDIQHQDEKTCEVASRKVNEQNAPNICEEEGEMDAQVDGTNNSNKVGVQIMDIQHQDEKTCEVASHKVNEQNAPNICEEEGEMDAQVDGTNNSNKVGVQIMDIQHQDEKTCEVASHKVNEQNAPNICEEEGEMDAQVDGTNNSNKVGVQIMDIQHQDEKTCEVASHKVNEQNAPNICEEEGEMDAQVDGTNNSNKVGVQIMDIQHQDEKTCEVASHKVNEQNAPNICEEEGEMDAQVDGTNNSNKVGVQIMDIQHQDEKTCEVASHKVNEQNAPNICEEEGEMDAQVDGTNNSNKVGVQIMDIQHQDEKTCEVASHKVNEQNAPNICEEEGEMDAQVDGTNNSNKVGVQVMDIQYQDEKTCEDAVTKMKEGHMPSVSEEEKVDHTDSVIIKVNKISEPEGNNVIFEDGSHTSEICVKASLDVKETAESQVNNNESHEQRPEEHSVSEIRAVSDNVNPKEDLPATGGLASHASVSSESQASISRIAAVAGSNSIHEPRHEDNVVRGDVPEQGTEPAGDNLARNVTPTSETAHNTEVAADNIHDGSTATLSVSNHTDNSNDSSSGSAEAQVSFNNDTSTTVGRPKTVSQQATVPARQPETVAQQVAVPAIQSETVQAETPLAPESLCVAAAEKVDHNDSPGGNSSSGKTKPVECCTVSSQLLDGSPAVSMSGKELCSQKNFGDSSLEFNATLIVKEEPLDANEFKFDEMAVWKRGEENEQISSCRVSDSIDVQSIVADVTPPLDVEYNKTSGCQSSSIPVQERVPSQCQKIEPGYETPPLSPITMQFDGLFENVPKTESPLLQRAAQAVTPEEEDNRFSGVFDKNQDVGGRKTCKTTAQPSYFRSNLCSAGEYLLTDLTSPIIFGDKEKQNEQTESCSSQLTSLPAAVKNSAIETVHTNKRPAEKLQNEARKRQKLLTGKVTSPGTSAPASDSSVLPQVFSRNSDPSAIKSNQQRTEPSVYSVSSSELGSAVPGGNTAHRKSPSLLATKEFARNFGRSQPELYTPQPMPILKTALRNPPLLKKPPSYEDATRIQTALNNVCEQRVGGGAGHAAVCSQSGPSTTSVHPASSQMQSSANSLCYYPFSYHGHNYARHIHPNPQISPNVQQSFRSVIQKQPLHMPPGPVHRITSVQHITSSLEVTAGSAQGSAFNAVPQKPVPCAPHTLAYHPHHTAAGSYGLRNPQQVVPLNPVWQCSSESVPQSQFGSAQPSQMCQNWNVPANSLQYIKPRQDSVSALKALPSSVEKTASGTSVCYYCGLPAMLRCRGCLKVKYCSSNCAAASWKRKHQFECQLS